MCINLISFWPPASVLTQARVKKTHTHTRRSLSAQLDALGKMFRIYAWAVKSRLHVPTIVM